MSTNNYSKKRCGKWMQEKFTSAGVSVSLWCAATN